jgi:hypothetical protein
MLGCRRAWGGIDLVAHDDRAHGEQTDAGRRIAGRYRLVKRLGSGAHGEVWLAQDIDLRRPIALKRVHGNDPRPVAERERALWREATVLAQLNHPNVVTVHHIVVDSDELWLVMEYVPAGSLADLGRISPDRVGLLATQLADVLVAMHRKGLLHCDIKPSNVLLAEDDLVKLSDFGLSRLPDGMFTLPGGRQIVGTPAFMAPEVAANESQPTPASDVFSLGATLYTLVEGHSPYGAVDDTRPMLQRAARAAITEPRRAGRLAPLLAGMLASDPEQRLTAGHVQNTLATLGFGQPTRSARLTRTRPRSRALALVPGSRGRLAVVAGGIGVVVVAAVLAYRPTASTHTPTVAKPPTLTQTQTPRLVVANQQVVDPCGLADADAMSRFGETDTSNDDGNFNRCDIYVNNAAGEVDMNIQLDTGEAPQGQVTHQDGLAVVAQGLNGHECDEAIVLADQNLVDITVKTTSPGQPTASLCPIADVATASAVHTLATKGLPRRGSMPPSWSWFYADACGLVDANGLAQLPGIDALHPDVGFSNWECTWHSTTGDGKLQVLFDRNGPLSAADGQPIHIAGKPAFLTQDKTDGSCEVDIEGHRYTDDRGSATVELLKVIITSDQRMTQMCVETEAVAKSAVAKLPS